MSKDLNLEKKLQDSLILTEFTTLFKINSIHPTRTDLTRFDEVLKKYKGEELINNLNSIYPIAREKYMDRVNSNKYYIDRFDFIEQQETKSKSYIRKLNYITNPKINKKKIKILLRMKTLKNINHDNLNDYYVSREFYDIRVDNQFLSFELKTKVVKEPFSKIAIIIEHKIILIDTTIRTEEEWSNFESELSKIKTDIYSDCYKKLM